MVRRPDPRPLIHGLVDSLVHGRIRGLGRNLIHLIRSVINGLVRLVDGPARGLAAAGAGIERRFTGRLHDERVAAWLGVSLGISFTVAFVTGLVSHFMQHPPAWAVWPARPVNLYRLTQGTHVICGMATIPLLLAKLWTVYPKFWQWPPLRGLAHALQRAVVLLLVGGSLFQLVTGLFNVDYWYPYAGVSGVLASLLPGQVGASRPTVSVHRAGPTRGPFDDHDDGRVDRGRSPQRASRLAPTPQ